MHPTDFHLLISAARFVLAVSAVLIFVSLSDAETVTAKGTIESVDFQARTITVRRKTANGEKTAKFAVGAKAEIVVDGQPSTLASLKAGRSVTISYDTEAKQITGLSVGPAAAPPPTKPANGAGPSDAERSLFSGKDLDGWSYIMGSSGRAVSSAWRVDSQTGLLQCLGADDHSKLVYRDEFADFTLKIEWRIPPGTRVSQDGLGVLVRAARPDATEQRSVAFQLNDRPRAAAWILGQSYNVALGKKSADFDGRLVLSSAKRRRGIGEWNDLEIICSGRQVTIRQNGADAIRLEDVDPGAGAVMLRAQGTVMELRNICLASAAAIDRKGRGPDRDD